MNMRQLITLLESVSLVPVLYHGTCSENAEQLLQHGWAPRTGAHMGPNGGQPRYLYLTTGPEDAEWFANERGCDVILEVKDIPMDFLIVDPEDGIGPTVQDELNNPHGLPGKLALKRPLSSEHFIIYKYPHLDESAPRGKKAERFIKKHKDEFKDRYGDAWEQVLYATAWKNFGKRKK